jgi:hypothetical protein
MDDDLEQRRNIKITFRINREEERRLIERIGGVSYSQYIRAGLFGYPRPRPRPIIPQVNRLTYIELNRIGNNINQQSAAINRAVLMGLQPLDQNTKIYLEELAALKELIAQTRREIAQVDLEEDESSEEDW